MTFLRTVHRLFMLVAMLAIVVGPMSIGLASSAMATSGASAMGDMSISMPGMQMTDNMPCCPDEQPAKPDCAKTCPVALICTTSIFAHAPHVHGWSFAVAWQSYSYDLIPASQPTSAFLEPPSRPPKV